MRDFVKRFRLSTLLLSVTLLCVALGWRVDRQRERERCDRIILGAACFNEMQTASDVLGMAKEYSATDTVLFRTAFDCSLLSVYEHQNEVDSFFEYKRPNQEKLNAVSLAGTYLWFLGYRSTDQYFDDMPDSKRSAHPHVKLATPEQVEGFRTFLDTAFKHRSGV